MKCPRCRTPDLKPTLIEEYLPAMGCETCHGSLVSLLYYRHWAETQKLRRESRDCGAADRRAGRDDRLDGRARLSEMRARDGEVQADRHGREPRRRVLDLRRGLARRRRMGVARSAAAQPRAAGDPHRRVAAAHPPRAVGRHAPLDPRAHDRRRGHVARGGIQATGSAAINTSRTCSRIFIGTEAPGTPDGGAPCRSSLRARWSSCSGTGNPGPVPERSGPATAIVVDDVAYLVDFGPGVIRRAYAAFRDKKIEALEPVKLRVAFATHLHSDHTVGYADLIFTPWTIGRQVPLEVYGPKGMKAMTEHCSRRTASTSRRAPTPTATSTIFRRAAASTRTTSARASSTRTPRSR